MAGISGGSVVWILDAETGQFTRAMLQAENQAKSTGQKIDREMQSTSSSIAKSLDGIGRDMQSIGKQMSLYVSAPIAAGFGTAVKSAGSFESSLSQLKYASGATASEMDQLTAVARTLGKDTDLVGVTAKDVSATMIELSKAGLDVKDTLAATKGVMALARAGNMDFADAAIIASGALNAFGFEGKDAIKVADALANGANESQASLHDLGLGLAASATVAKQFKLSLNDNVTALALFANNGIKSSDAGTSLKTMLIQLATPSKEAAGLMKQLGFNAYDAQGNFVGLREMSLRLNQSLQGLTDEQKQAALATIFGSDAFRAAAILSDNAGASYDRMSAKVGQTGSAIGAAAAQLGPYEKQLEAFKNAMSELGLVIGEKLLPKATELAKGLTDVINKFGELDPKIQDFIIGAGLVAAAIGPVTFALGTFARAIGTTITVVSGISRGIGAVVTWLTVFGQGFANAKVAASVFSGVAGTLGGIVRTVLVSSLNILMVALRAVGAAFMATPYGWIILAITAIVGAFIWLWNNVEGFRNFWIGLWNGLVTVVQGFSTGATQWLTSFVTQFQALFSGIGSFFQAIWGGIVAYFTWVWNTVISIFTTVGAVIGAVVSSIVSFFQPLIQIFQFIGYAIAAFGQIVFTIFSAIAQIVWTVVSTIVQIIGVILYGSFLWLWNNVLIPTYNFFVMIFTNILNFLIGVFTTIGSFIATVWNAYLNIIITVATTIWNFIVTAFNAIMGVITSVMNVILGVISAVWNAIWSVIGPVVTTIVNFVVERFNNLMNNVMNVFNSIRSFITNAINAAASAVSGAIGNVVNFVRDGLNNAYNTASNFVNQFTSAGKNVIDGLVKGISGGAGAVVNKVKEIASGALDAVKSFFGIKSPSRVMAKMGDYMMEGWTKGINRSASAAIDAAQKASEGVLGGFSSLSDNSINVTASGSLTGSLAPISSSDYGDVDSTTKVYEYQIGSITIGNEVDGEAWLQKLTKNQEIISNGITPQTRYN